MLITFPKIHISLERWRKHNNGYYVSNLGNIKDKNKKEVKFYVNQDGYFCILIDEKYQRVHRLVAECWCKGQKENFTVDHLNSNKRDNRAVNLQWISYEENISRGIAKYITDGNEKIIFNKNCLNMADVNKAAYTKFGVSAAEIYEDAKKGKYLFCSKDIKPVLINKIVSILSKKCYIDPSKDVEFYKRMICAYAIKGEKYFGRVWSIERNQNIEEEKVTFLARS